ncbi:hypothetical protein HDU89_006840 [Geranomyces variabilis]|nr:hypothetical protein HDU89_006840 [Geranomyces variabilis]
MSRFASIESYVQELPRASWAALIADVHHRRAVVGNWSGSTEAKLAKREKEQKRLQTLLRSHRAFEKIKAKQKKREEEARSAGVSWLASRQGEVQNTTAVLDMISDKKRKRSASDGPGEAEDVEEEVEKEVEEEVAEEAEVEEDKAAEPNKVEDGEEEEEEGSDEASAQSAASAEESQSDASSDEEEASEGSIVTVVGDVLDTAESVAAEEDENDGAAGALNREYIAQHFKDIHNFKAKKDFVVEDVNLTVLFCKVRFALYQKVIERNEIIEIENATRHDVLAAHNIFFFSTFSLPPYLNSRKPENEKAKKSLWRRIISNEIQRFNYQGNSIGLSSTAKEFAAAAVGDPIAIDLLHAKKTAELNLTDVSFLARYRALQVCRGFAFAVNEQERRSSSKLAEDEDTGVHLWLHDLLVETFRGCDSVVMWANGESSSSKAHRAPWAKSGKKPDFRVVYKDRENVFGEFKRKSIAVSNPLVAKDFIKLAVFMQGSINQKSRDAVKPNETFGIQMSKDLLDVFVMRLRFEGVYELYQIGSQRLPRQARDFALVVGAFELLWSIRKQMRADHEPDDITAAAAFAESDSDMGTASMSSSPEKTMPGHPTPKKVKLTK